MNALKSGIDARTVVLPTESQEEYNLLVTEWHAEHKPTTTAARALVDRLVANEWLNRRYFTLAATIIAKYINNNQKYLDPEFPIASAWQYKSPEMVRLMTHVSALNRHFHKDLDQLHYLEAQSELASQPEPEPEPAPQPAEPEPVNPSPASFLKKPASPAPKPPARAENATAIPADPPPTAPAVGENQEKPPSNLS